MEADAEIFLRDQGFLPATEDESRIAREAVAALDAKNAR